MAESRVAAALLGVLTDYAQTLVARSILDGAVWASGVDPDVVTASQSPRLLTALDVSLRRFVLDASLARECSDRLAAALDECILATKGAAGEAELVVNVHHECDIVTARDHAATLCDEVGFGHSERVKIATVVSELARNIVQYAERGYIELVMLKGDRPGIEIRAVDRGPGIANIDRVLDGGYRSSTGLGVGLLGTRRLMDEFDVDTEAGRGTRVTVRKYMS